MKAINIILLVQRKILFSKFITNYLPIVESYLAKNWHIIGLKECNTSKPIIDSTFGA